jgi:hypothetical protein
MGVLKTVVEEVAIHSNIHTVVVEVMEVNPIVETVPVEEVVIHNIHTVVVEVMEVNPIVETVPVEEVVIHNIHTVVVGVTIAGGKSVCMYMTSCAFNHRLWRSTL